MPSQEILNTTSAIERRQAADTLAALLEGVEYLPEYADANPRMKGTGNTIDSLRRVTHGIATDPAFDHAVLIGALVHVISDQQERIEALEAKAAKKTSSASRRNTKRGREGAA